MILTGEVPKSCAELLHNNCKNTKMKVKEYEHCVFILPTRRCRAEETTISPSEVVKVTNYSSQGYRRYVLSASLQSMKKLMAQHHLEMVIILRRSLCLDCVMTVVRIITFKRVELVIILDSFLYMRVCRTSPRDSNIT